MKEYVFLTSKRYKIVINVDHSDSWQYDIYNLNLNDTLVGGGNCGADVSNVEDALAFALRFYDVGEILDD